MGSFAFTATPGKAGEGINNFLNQQLNLLKAPVLIALIIERLTDVISILVIFTLNLEFLPVFNYLKTINVIFVATLVLGLIILSFRKIKVFQKTVIFMIEKILLMKNSNFKRRI